MVAKHFKGDQIAAKHYLAALGLWNSEKVFEGTPIPVRACYPGPSRIGYRNTGLPICLLVLIVT